PSVSTAHSLSHDACDLARSKPNLAQRISAMLRAVGRAVGGGRFVLTLGDARLFAGQTLEIIELRAPHAAAAQNLDRIHHRAIDGEDALHAFAIGNLPHGEVLVHALALAA